MGMIKKLPEDEEFVIITHHNGVIDGMSSGLNRIFNLKQKKLKSNKFNIFQICPELQEVFWNLNGIREFDKAVDKDNCFDVKLEGISSHVQSVKKNTISNNKTMNFQADFQSFKMNSFNESSARKIEKNFCSRGVEINFKIPKKITNFDINSRTSGTNPATFVTYKTTHTGTTVKGDNDSGAGTKFSTSISGE